MVRLKEWALLTPVVRARKQLYAWHTIKLDSIQELLLSDGN